MTAHDDHTGRMYSDLYAPSFIERPYWHEGIDLSVRTPGLDLPTSADVVVIGGGYTGLSAATAVASHGRSVAVLEAKTLGAGCSGLNGGQVSTSLKPGFSRLSARFDSGRALAIHQEGIRALERLRGLVAERNLECDWQSVGRFLGAYSRRHYDQLLKLREMQQRELNIPSEVVSREDQNREIGTAIYHGGLLYPLHASVHPAKLLRELYRLAQETGVEYFEHQPVTAVERHGDRFRVHTAQRTIAARNVIIATNGYTGPFSPWHRRRVIPISSQLIATESLPEALMHTLLPTRRVISDTRRVIVYYRASPDGKRIVFGGRATIHDTPAATFAPRLMRWLRQIFPQLENTRITHAWAGTVAYTFDELPHLGEHDGVHYCMGYCGSGVSLSTYFGWKIGLQVVGRPEGRTALDNIPFPTRPLYSGHPWFLGPAILAYRALDALNV
jgi:glycine/D-amino acid oxidase-like deaminating enzyme